MVESKQNPSSSTCRSSGFSSSSGSISKDGGGGDFSIHDGSSSSLSGSSSSLSSSSSSSGRDSKEKSAEISYDVPETLFRVSEKFVVRSNPEVISYIHYILTHTCILTYIHTYIHTYTFMFENSAVEYLYRNLPMKVLQSILRACGQRYTDIVSRIPTRTVTNTV